jgi:lipoprotein signal peptidase
MLKYIYTKFTIFTNNRGRENMLVTIISWASALTVLTGFLLISQGKVKSDNQLYLSLNFFGSLGLAFSAFSTKTYAFVLLNTVWGLVALITLLRARKTKVKTKNATA